MVTIINFLLYVFYHNLKKKWKEKNPILSSIDIKIIGN